MKTVYTLSSQQIFACEWYVSVFVNDIEYGIVYLLLMSTPTLKFSITWTELWFSMQWMYCCLCIWTSLTHIQNCLIYHYIVYTIVYRQLQCIAFQTAFHFLASIISRLFTSLTQRINVSVTRRGSFSKIATLFTIYNMNILGKQQFGS